MRFRKGRFPFLSLCVCISDGQVVALIYIRFAVSVGIAMIYHFHVNVLINDGSFYYFRFCYIAFNCRGWHAVRFAHCKICLCMCSR